MTGQLTLIILKQLILCLLLLFPVFSLEAKQVEPPQYLVDIVKEVSEEYDISFVVPLMIIRAESGFNPLALNRNDMKKGCHSRGLAQIRSCNHEVTDKQAYNPEFAIRFLIRNLAEDRCQTWWKGTCPLARGVKLSTEGDDTTLK